jgi:hypothetical protein
VDNGSKATAKMMAGLDLGDKYSHLCAYSTPKMARYSRRVGCVLPPRLYGGDSIRSSRSRSPSRWEPTRPG